ncbi:MAG TPA: DUF456 domain-containing protein [Candidatus Hydrogenedentes bacterium]|nr:DUF456 domain-containing protein [Candidatus Hydrogenedentota bacterium]
MSIIIAILGWTAFGAAILVGLFLDLIGLFGNWIILGAVALAWLATGREHFGIWCILALAGLAALGEVLEFLGADLGAKRFGASKGSTLSVLAGCIVGGIAGTPVFPIVGSVLGACVGAFIGAACHEFIVMEKQPGTAAWTGFGAALGKVAGILAKLVVGFVMLGVAALAY